VVARRGGTKCDSARRQARDEVDQNAAQHLLAEGELKV
jgi:hypothetical protein